jgi:hypothetical protein
MDYGCVTYSNTHTVYRYRVKYISQTKVESISGTHTMMPENESASATAPTVPGRNTSENLPTEEEEEEDDDDDEEGEEEEGEEEREFHLRSSERLLFFTDAVVAIAATLLILPLMEAAARFGQQSDEETRRSLEEVEENVEGGETADDFLLENAGHLG